MTTIDHEALYGDIKEIAERGGPISDKADDLLWEAAREIAQDSEKQQATATETPERIRSFCGCGYGIVWTGDGWQHDAAPYFWGGDHDIDEPEPDPENPARRYWDVEDGVREA